jgi:hypothetical protein
LKRQSADQREKEAFAAPKAPHHDAERGAIISDSLNVLKVGAQLATLGSDVAMAESAFSKIAQFIVDRPSSSVDKIDLSRVDSMSGITGLK